jgi:hypothetical protein
VTTTKSPAMMSLTVGTVLGTRHSTELSTTHSRDELSTGSGVRDRGYREVIHSIHRLPADSRPYLWMTCPQTGGIHIL